MKPNDIKNLIEKFYEGETTEQEDLLLVEYFENEDVPGEFVVEKQYFQSVKNMSQASLDDSFEHRLMEKISKEQPSNDNYRIWMYSLSGIAATIAIVITVWLGTDVFEPNKVYGTIEDPNIAFMETKKVLEDVSATMNKGLTPANKTVTKVKKNVQRAGEFNKMNDALDNVKKIRKIDDASDFLKSFSKVYVNYGNS